jgi:8-oxo-dGTP diphosphatase
MAENEVSFDVRAIAMILRERNGKLELLAQSFTADPSIPWRFPGGGIERGENIEDGLCREIMEESGLDQLEFIRKLGVQRYFKSYLSRFIERHDFFFRTQGELPDEWEHIVHGSGKDNGEIFSFHWISPEDVYRIDPELQKFLDYKHLPEFFIGI